MFEKNFQALSNDALKARLSKITPEESRVGISYCVTPSQDYVLLKDDMPADDLNDPRAAIKQMLKTNIKTEMAKNDIIINFGIGMGYLLDEVFMAYPSRILIYEPDIKLLHFVLQNVDISEHLSSGRVYISDNIDELIHHLETIYLSKDKVEIAYLPNYAIVKNEELLNLTQKIFEACKSKMVDINTILKFSKIWMTNTITNISNINGSEVYKISDLEGKFIGQTALILGAGPSLSEDILKIKEKRDKFIIFAVNKAVKYLLENDVIPDFIVCLDAGNMCTTLESVSGRLSQSCCIMDIRTDNFLMGLNFKKIFISFSDSDTFIKKLANYNNFIKQYEAGGSTTILALVSAVKLGFSRILLSGIDLAFKDNQIYANGDKLERVSQEEIMVAGVKQRVTQVKSVNDTMIYTREDYKTFIKHFEDVIRTLGHTAIYNTSSFGANIEGTKNMRFSEINLPVPAKFSMIEYADPFKLEVKEFIEEEFFNINNIISILSKGVFSLELVTAIVKSAFIYQYMQAEVLQVLQKNFAPELAENFINETKASIKTVVDLLQKSKLI